MFAVAINLCLEHVAVEIDFRDAVRTMRGRVQLREARVADRANRIDVRLRRGLGP